MLNEMQKSTIRDYLSFPLESITDLKIITLEQAQLALQAIFNDEIYNKNSDLFEKIDIKNEIDQIRKILEHPCPQNRSTGDYISVGQEPGMAVWLDRNDLDSYIHNGNSAGKPKVKKEHTGLLSLTARNDHTNVNSPVTKENVVNYIKEIVNKKSEEIFGLLNPQCLHTIILPDKSTVKQRKIEFINHKSIEDQLSKGKIAKILQDSVVEKDGKNYIVQLDNGLIAVFHEIADRERRKEEIIAYKMASRLFKLQHTIVPTVEKEYKYKKGILQYYVPHEFKFSDRTSIEEYENLYKVINNISKESYADLQTFRYVTNLMRGTSLIFYRNNAGEFCITSLENINQHIVFQKFGETHLGATDITNYVGWYPQDAFNSSYTSFFNSNTIENMNEITKEKIRLLYHESGYMPDEAYIDRIKTCCEEVITKSQSMILQGQLLVTMNEDNANQTAIIATTPSSRPRTIWRS